MFTGTYSSRVNVAIVYETFLNLLILINFQKNKVVVFMKGVPEEPKCGFSNAVVQIMRMHAVDYDAHDVLKNEDLRQGNCHLTF